jgi:hypothetical protein
MPSKSKEKRNKTNKEYYHRNREKILAKAKETSKEQYLKHKEQKLARTRDSRERHYEKHLYKNIRARCSKANIPFDIEVSDIIIPSLCPYLGCELTRTQGKGKVWTNASVDRIDPTKGYVKGNIQILSNKANLMKAHASQEELIIFATNVLKVQDEIRKFVA